MLSRVKSKKRSWFQQVLLSDTDIVFGLWLGGFRTAVVAGTGPGTADILRDTIGGRACTSSRGRGRRGAWELLCG